jgi:predicted chitinase
MLDVSLDADVDNDHFVNLEDYARLAARWLNNCDAMNNWCDETDINMSTKVDIADLAKIITDWLKPI